MKHHSTYTIPLTLQCIHAGVPETVWGRVQDLLAEEHMSLKDWLHFLIGIAWRHPCPFAQLQHDTEQWGPKDPNTRETLGMIWGLGAASGLPMLDVWLWATAVADADNLPDLLELTDRVLEERAEKQREVLQAMTAASIRNIQAQRVSAKPRSRLAG